MKGEKISLYTLFLLIGGDRNQSFESYATYISDLILDESTIFFGMIGRLLREELNLKLHKD